MNGYDSEQFLLTQARSYLQSAEETLLRPDYKLVVQCAQIALELSAKAIISHYHEPEWTHDPSGDLLGVIRAHGKKMEKRLGKATMRESRKLATDAKQYAEWHILSTYGRHALGERPQSPDELCTSAVAASIMPCARHAVALATRFVDLFV